jgi:uncharacterized membrane protein YheB (UPF0754 family)
MGAATPDSKLITMSYWLILIPVLTAFAGWLSVHLLISILFRPLRPVSIAGVTIQGIFPGKQQELAVSAGKLAQAEFEALHLEEKMTSPESIQKIMPAVETHIDHFLRVKLAQSMPMISMFIGDKTIEQLKGVFMTELEVLFPILIKDYVHTLQQDLDIAQAVTSKIAAISPAALAVSFHQALGKELRTARWMAVLVGLCIGVLQLAILLIA